jgi:ATP-binding cassette subfamily F protein uup
MSYKEQREFDALPGRISALEDEQQLLKDEAASAEFYKAPADRIGAVLARIDVVQVELDAALERWIELEAIAQTPS